MQLVVATIAVASLTAMFSFFFWWLQSQASSKNKYGLKDALVIQLCVSALIIAGLWLQAWLTHGTTSRAVILIHSAALALAFTINLTTAFFIRRS